MASNEPIDYDTLVREDRVHSSVYNDPQIFEDEVERVWRSRQDIFAARVLHTLRPAGDSFHIALKKVLLLNNDDPIDNLTFLV